MGKLLFISTASLVCSAATLVVMAKTAHELKMAKHEVDGLKTRVAHNAQAVKAALSAIQL